MIDLKEVRKNIEKQKDVEGIKEAIKGIEKDIETLENICCNAPEEVLDLLAEIKNKLTGLYNW